MPVNLSTLERYGRAAVYCSSEEQAEQFMKAMWEQHPEKVRGAWSRGQTNWRDGSEDIFYLPRIFHTVSGGEYSHCQSSSLSWVTAHNYSIVPFQELVQGFDLGELTASEVDIKSLFDMG